MTLFKLASILIIVAIAGSLFWSFRLVPESDFVVSVTAFSIGVVTFFGITELNRSAEDSRVFREENLRTAIAGSLVVTYLFIVCFTSFVRSAETAGLVTKEFIQSFSQVISYQRYYRVLLWGNCGHPNLWEAQGQRARYLE